MLTLSLFDPAGWRGSGHRHGTQHEVTIGLDEASPGFVAGPLPPGAWQAVVDTHMIMPGTPCAIRMEVSATDAQAEGQVQGLPLREVAGPTMSRGRGWYRGDLHAHSLHSDAAWDIPELVAWARARRLDFAALSDHNTISGLAQMDASGSAELLTMGGMEFTTFWGHALALGIRQWVDWRVTTDASAARRTMEQIPAEVEALGGLFVIAHPMAIGDPYCTGCQWRYPAMTPGSATAVEVWNSDWASESRNELALSLAYGWLNAGHRLALSAGTDNHGRGLEQRHYGFNVVYAEELSEREILRAVRAGHSYLSAGPALELNAVADKTAAMMGDRLYVPRGQEAQLTARWAGCPDGAEVCLVVDGQPGETVPAVNQGTRTWSLAGGEARWCLVTLREAGGRMLALTNPIFFDGRTNND